MSVSTRSLGLWGLPHPQTFLCPFWISCSAISRMLYILKLSYVPSHSNGNLMPLLLLQPLKWVHPPPPPLSLTTGLGGGAGVLFGSHCQCRPLQAMPSPFSRKMPSLEFHVMPASFLDSAPSCPLQDVAPAFLSHSHISSPVLLGLPNQSIQCC